MPSFGRVFLLISLLLAIVSSIPAEAILFSGAPISAPPSGQVTTLDIVNTSSSTQSSNFVTQMFGHPFKKGDIANGCSGGAPTFQLMGGTNIPFSEGLNPVCWTDGSLKWAPFMLKVPVSIGGSYSISSGTYNTSTGVIVITTSSTPTGVIGGSIVNIDGLTGTGNPGAITGSYAVASVSGSNVTLNGQSGYGTLAITGGTLAQAVQVKIYSGGTTPSNSGFSPSNLTTGGHDPNVQVTGKSNLSGTYVSDLAQGITDANSDNYNYMDGQAGAVQRVRECFRLTNTSGSCHGQLEGYFYVQELPNSGGTFGFGRWMHRLAEPWYNVTSPQQSYLTFSAWATYDGASLAKSMFSTQFGVSNNFDWHVSDCIGSACGFFEATGYTPGSVFVINANNTGGSLPSGMAANTDYWVYPGGAASANQTWFTMRNGTSDGSGVVVPASACTGTCSFTAYPWIPPFGSLFTANPNGLYDFFQGSGSVSADSHVRITFNNYYWRSTRMIPPYALGAVGATPYINLATSLVGPGGNTNFIQNYIPDTLGPIQAGIDATGESDWIGPEPVWVSNHVFLQDASDENYIRTVSLDGQTMPVMLLNNSTHTIPVVNNTTYTGMPSPNTSLYWSASAVIGYGGVQPVANSSVWLGTYQDTAFVHMPEWDYYAELAFGEPQFHDNLQNWGSTAVVNHVGGLNPGTTTINSQINAMGGYSSNGSGERSITLSGTTYYGLATEFDDLTRPEAWSVRTEGQALAIGSSYGPAAASVHQYFNDNLNAQYTVESTYQSMLPALAQTLGTMSEAQTGAVGQSESWTQGYNMMSLAYISAINDTPSWGQIATGNFTAKFWKFVDSTFGVWAIPTYEDARRMYSLYNTPSAGSQDYAPYLTNTNNYCITGTGSSGGGTQWTIGWNASSATFTDLTYPTNYVETNGDIVIFWGDNGGYFGTPPAALTSYGANSGYWFPFYMVNANPSLHTFQLAATSGGSPITMTDTNNTTPCVAPYGMKSYTTTSINNAPLGRGYMQNEVGALNWWSAVGGTVDATTLSDMQNNLSALGGYQPYSTGYYFGPNFFLPANDMDMAEEKWSGKLLLRAHP